MTGPGAPGPADATPPANEGRPAADPIEVRVRAGLAVQGLRPDPTSLARIVEAFGHIDRRIGRLRALGECHAESALQFRADHGDG